MLLLSLACSLDQAAPDAQDTGVVHEQDAPTSSDHHDEGQHLQVDEGVPTRSESLPESQRVTLELTRSMDVATALTATWTAPEGAESWLEVDGWIDAFGVGRTDLVLLAPQATEVTARAVAEIDGERIESDAVTVSTGTFAASLDLAPVALQQTASVKDELVLFAYDGGDDARVVLMTGAGETLWQIDGARFDGTAPVSAQASLDGRGVLVGLWASHAPALTTDRMQDNAIWLYGWDGAPVQELETPMAHHLFSQPEPGVVAWTGLNPVQREGEPYPVAFEKLMLTDMDAGDAVVWDTQELGYDDACNSPGYYQDACDVHHANSMDCDMETGDCLYSLHNLESVYVVRHDGGQEDLAQWTAVDRAGAPQLAFKRAHDVHWGRDGSVLVFNDGSEEGSWAARYQVDRQAGLLRELWSYGRDLCINSGALGTVQELPSGNHLVGFSAPSNLLREVDPEGQVVWELDLGGLSDEERCDSNDLSAVLGEARMLTRAELGPEVVALF